LISTRNGNRTKEFEMGRFDGRVAIVTGAAQGIGAAIARRLASEGAQVAVVDLTAERAQGTADEIVKAGGAA
jgi:3-oxoacyl-[acyl-carrier protein] reductase